MNSQALLNILMSQDFADWHAGEFENYVTGEENAPSVIEVLNTLQEFINRHH
jgi:hypothetical protein